MRNTKRANSMKSVLQIAILLGVVITLSSCSGMFTNQARCPFTDKGGCQSVSDVNQMVDEHKFTKDGHFVQQAADTNASGAAYDDVSDDNVTQPGGWNSATPYSGEPLRTQEVEARMWVAPWQDKSHAYHGSSYINFVVSGSHWTALPAKAITGHDYDDRG